MKIKVVCIADLQGMCGNIEPDMLPPGDILLVAGDIAGWGTHRELVEANKWLATLPYAHKVIVGGNHDQDLRKYDGHELFDSATYLENEIAEVMGLTIYGTPANEMNQYRFNYDWAFCDPPFLAEAAEKMPEGIDIVLTHGPAFGFTDRVVTGQNVGSKDLRDAIVRKKPRYVVCGHIHEAHGVEEFNGTTFVNAALCSRYNEMLKHDGSLYYDPIVLEIETE